MSSLVFSPATAPSGPTAAGLIIDRNGAAAVDGFSFVGAGGCPAIPAAADEASSEGDSSIGSLSDDDDDDPQDEAESKSTNDDSTGSSSLTSLTSLEDSLPFKKSLSSHFVGKSRSFSNLSECAAGNAADIAKQENPFNKRRRIQIATRMSYKRRASCSSLVATMLPQLLSPEHTLQEAEDENDDGSDDDDFYRSSNGRGPGSGDLYNENNSNNNNNKKIGKAPPRPPRSISLFDLRCV